MRFFLALLIIGLSIGPMTVSAGHLPEPEPAKNLAIEPVDPNQRSAHNLNTSDGYRARSTNELKHLKSQGNLASVKLSNAHNL